MGDIRELQSTDEEEALLRATLAEGAAADIEVDRAWATFSQRIAAPKMRVTSARGVRIRGRLITLPAIAAALALAVLLMGAGYKLWAGPFAGSELQLIGQKHLYTAVNQSQTAGGLTITVTNVYADEGRTLIAYTITPSSELRGRYTHAVLTAWDLKDQYGHEPGGAGGTTQCTPLPSDGGPAYCLMDVPSFGITGDTLHLTWAIHTAWLLEGGTQTTDNAGWHFDLSMPYLHINNGDGVYPQICNTAANPCKGPASK